MNASLRRGACPSLSTPMQTGDGLLVRLSLADRTISTPQLATLARAAGEYGNGIMEITSKGSLQIRGLTTSSAAMLAAVVDDFDLALQDGVPVEISPLAGIDPYEIADPRPLASTIRDGIAALGLVASLGPKVSIIVDGGGHSMLSSIKADIRLLAVETHRGTLWQLALAGDQRDATTIGTFAGSDACAAVLNQLQALAERGPTARGKHLLPIGNAPRGSPGDASKDVQNPAEMIRLTDCRFAAKAWLPFGTAEATQLAGFADALTELDITDLRLSPERLLFLLCGDEASAYAARDLAEAHGFITHASDKRLSIIACAGAPACASAHYNTRALAREISSEALDIFEEPFRLHLSGCDKHCADTGGPLLTLTGHGNGCDITTRDLYLPPALRDYFARRGILGPDDRRAS